MLTAAGQYPLVLLLFTVLQSTLDSVAPWVAKLLIVLLTVPLMSWGIMPGLTRLFRGWLYPRRPRPH